MLLGILSLPTLESLHITEPLIKSLREVVLLWPISFPRNTEWKISTPPCGFSFLMELWSNLIKFYLDTSHSELW
jgi:hypothetical protein